MMFMVLVVKNKTLLLLSIFLNKDCTCEIVCTCSKVVPAVISKFFENVFLMNGEGYPDFLDLKVCHIHCALMLNLLRLRSQKGWRRKWCTA